jgi:hydrophobic/amphiphilic exporter-1 (mainly G- bacteria), HAE1 family
MTSVLMLAIVLAGIVGYRSLPVAALPKVDFPTIAVSAALPGASPENMAATVATPLERQFATIAGITSIVSTNALGLTQITLQFDLDRNIDAAAQDVQSAISVAQPLLPVQMPTPPSYQKINPADSPILILSLRSDVLPMNVVDEYAETNLAPRISTLSGVAQVFVFGSQKFAVRIQVDPKQLTARGIGIDEVMASVQNNNVITPAGVLDRGSQAFTMMASGQLYTAADYRKMIVAYRNGAAVRLTDVATVLDGVQSDRVASWTLDDNRVLRRSVGLAVFRQPGTNTVQIVDNVKRLMPVFRAQLPQAVALNIVGDRSQSVRESIGDVQWTLLLTVVLVVLVIFMFLRNVRATLIPAIAVPLSVVGTFAAMYFCNYSLDNLSLMALTVAVGFVVDDAVVMLENIFRHIEDGMDGFSAALQGAKEIGFTIVSMTVSLVAVFIPLLFMGGIVGRLFREFAVTLTFAIVISGIVSLTLTPMMCARFLRHDAGGHGRMYRFFEGIFDWALRTYERLLGAAMHHRRMMLAATLASLVVTILIVMSMPKGFLPNEDTGQIFAFTEGGLDFSFPTMAEHQIQAANIVAKNPDVQNFLSSVGAGGSNVSGNTGRMYIILKPSHERSHSAAQVIQQLRPLLSKVIGFNTFMQPIQNITVGGRLAKAQYQYTLQDTEVQELYTVSQQMLDKLRTLPLVQDVSSDMQLTAPLVELNINRDSMSKQGVTAGQITDALYSAYGQRQVSTIYTDTNQYWVILEVKPEFQRNLDDLSDMYIRSSSGALVPLSSLAKVSRRSGPLTVNHQGQLPAVTLTFNMAPGRSLGDAVNALRGFERDIRMPATVTTTFQGTAQAFQSSLGGEGFLIFAAVVVIYLVLCILYESWIHPITILSGLPSAAVGACVTLMLFGADLSLIAIIGIVMLVGIVKKNAIMMVDFAVEAQREKHLSPQEAIRQACLLRFRPIMMTTFAAIMGTLPIAVGLGAGAELRQPLGLCMVGGLITSQLLTLFITPVIYLYLEEAQAWWRARRPAKAPVPAASHTHPSPIPGAKESAVGDDD